jgi:hypothetical protein
MSGNRLALTLLHELQRRGVEVGLPRSAVVVRAALLIPSV